MTQGCIVEPDAPPYAERVVTDDSGRVMRIERRYPALAPPPPEPGPAPAGPRPAPPGGRGYAFCKRAFDIVVSIAVLVLAAPLLGLVALLILVEDGPPVFFGHARQSRGGRRFRCWKFRTMVRHSQRLVPQLAGMNRCDGPHVFIPDDPRVTRVGRVLRRFHVDELPQLWNVLAGDMSIVGPRPSPEAENRYCPAWREIRLSVRPGITGLWQLHRTRAPGRDFQEWIRYDIEYVRRASFRLDLAIFFRTAWMLAAGARHRSPPHAP